MIGVLGGMGPLATADFFSKLLEETPANGDEEHVPVLIASDPRIPPRPPAILSGGDSPLPAMIRLRDKLIGAGATALAMPCNTAHYWYADLARECPVPFISIVESSVMELGAAAAADATVGLIATRATLQARVYDDSLQQRGYALLPPTEAELEGGILPSIRAVKAGDPKAAGNLLAPVVQAMLDRGASTVLLACTETPIALASIGSPLLERCMDPTRALARACVRHWIEGEKKRAVGISA